MKLRNIPALKSQSRCAKVSRGRELMAGYRIDSPSLAVALAEIADDLLAGRIEKICADGRRLDDEEIAALLPARNT